TMKEAFRLKHNGGVRALAFCPDSCSLASASADGFGRIWDLSGKKPNREIVCRGHTGAVLAVIWSHDGRTVFTAGHDGTIRQWDAERGQERSVIRLDRPIGTLTRSPNDRYLVGGNDGPSLNLNEQSNSLIRVWERSTGKVV